MDSLKITNKIMNEYSIKANKRFGQNFLIDDNVLQNIVSVSDVSSDDMVIEIGPGLGNLTEYLIGKAGHVLLIEIDNKMVEILNDRFKDKKNYTLVNEDILKSNIDELIRKIETENNAEYKKIKVVANLPYYITTPIIFKLLQESDRISEIVVMVQKEVAERMVASPKSKDYGILTLMVDYLADAKIQIIVPNNSFIPAPDVTSAVIQLKKNKKYLVKNEKVFFELIHKAFMQRRKKMSNSLASNKFLNMSKEDINEMLHNSGVSENARAEELPIDKYVEIVNGI